MKVSEQAKNILDLCSYTADYFPQNALPACRDAYGLSPAPGVPGRRITQNKIEVFICENQRDLRETLFWYCVKRHAERSEASRQRLIYHIKGLTQIGR
jgi:hypothetical protein